MNLGRFFARLSLYRASRGVPLWVLVALAVGFYFLAGVGEAQAGYSTKVYGSRSEAWTACANSQALVEGFNPGHAPTYCTLEENVNHAAGKHRIRCQRTLSATQPELSGCGGSSHPEAVSSHYFNDVPNDGCAVDYQWSESQNKCVPSDEACLAINAQPGFIGVGTTTRNFTSKCMLNGCMFGPVGQTAVVSVGGVAVSYTGQYEWTGACATPPPPEAPEPEAVNADNTAPQYCVPNTVPQMCIKNDGEHCIAASTGTQLCWRPGETGTKTTGDTAQKRVPGTQPATPPTPPEGETFTQGDSITATTTKDGSATTTTTTNFKTGAGTDAGTVDQGEPDDGSAGSGVERDEPGSVSGGDGCETPPAVQGDPLLANIILQTWGTRCAELSSNAVTSTGEIGDCASPWTISGPAEDANVQKLKAARAEICGDDANGDGQPDWTEGSAPGTPGDGDPADEIGPPSGLNVSTDLLDQGGLLGGGATCPALGVIDFGFTSFDMNSEPMWCDLVTLMRAIVLLMAAFTAIKILMGGN